MVKKLLFALIFSVVTTSAFSQVATVLGGYNSTAVTITLSFGGGSLLPAAPFVANWWNYTDYGLVPTNDPQNEKINVTSKTGDTLVVVRGYLSAAYNHNTPGKTYAIQQTSNFTPVPSNTPTVTRSPTNTPVNTPTATYTPTAAPGTNTPTPTPGLSGLGVPVYPTGTWTVKAQFYINANPGSTPTWVPAAWPTPVPYPTQIPVSDWPTAVPYPTQYPLPPTPNGGPAGISFWSSPTPSARVGAIIVGDTVGLATSANQNAEATPINALNNKSVTMNTGKTAFDGTQPVSVTNQFTPVTPPTQIPLNPTPVGGPIGQAYAASPTPGINTNVFNNVTVTDAGVETPVAGINNKSVTINTSKVAFDGAQPVSQTNQFTAVPQNTQIPLNPTPVGGPIGQAYAASPTPGINVNSNVLAQPNSVTTPLAGINAKSVTMDTGNVTVITMPNSVTTPLAGINAKSVTMNTGAVAFASTPIVSAYMVDGAGNTISSTGNSIWTNLKQVGGTNVDTNSGNKSAGTMRMVLATDQPALTNALPMSMTNAIPAGSAAIGSVSVSSGGVSLLTNSAAIGSVSVSSGGVSLLTNTAAIGSVSVSSGGVSLLAGSAALGGVTVLGSLPAGSNAIGGVTVLNAIPSHGVSLLAGSSIIGAVTIVGSGSVTAVGSASATRSASVTLGDFSKPDMARCLIVIFDVTTVTGSGIFTVAIDGKDPTSGKYINQLVSANVSTTSTNKYTIFPGATAVANVTANDLVYPVYRIRLTLISGTSQVSSVGLNYSP